MTMLQKIIDRSEASSGEERSALGAARACEAAFDAVYSLWSRREDEGLRKKDLATILDKNPSWVTRSLAGPGNWTLETLGALAEGLDALIEINLRAREDIVSDNYDIYADVIDGTPHIFCPVDARPTSNPSKGTQFTVNIGKGQPGRASVTIRGARISVDHTDG